MSESPEHLFLKNTFLEILSDFSKLDFYKYTETERKKFDLSCILKNDLSRPLVGQTLWNHFSGIEKDIRTLLYDDESEIKVYIAKHETKYYASFEDIIKDYRKTDRREQLYKLKTIWLPPDFDADNISHQKLIKKLLSNYIINDILFNVVFGNITARDIDLFLNVSGIPGLNLIILYEIAQNGFLNYPDLKRRIDMCSIGPIREKIILLSSIGFLIQPRMASMYKVSLKGKVFLDIIKRLVLELQTESLSEELQFILEKLGCTYIPVKDIIYDSNIFPDDNFSLLVRTIKSASKQWDIDWNEDIQVKDYYFLDNFVKK